MQTTKKCSKCRQEKPLDEFYRLAVSKDGRRPDCKACNGIPATPPTPEERFWNMVDIPENTCDCWWWLGGNNGRSGYGRFWLRGKKIGAHRYSYELHYGEIPKGLFVLHKCDEPGCVNPGHLFLGTKRHYRNDFVCADGHFWSKRL